MTSKRGRKSYLRSKNNFKWSLNAPEIRGRRLLQREHEARAKEIAQDVSTAREAWSLLFTDKMLDKIVTHTNEEIERFVAGFRAKNARILPFNTIS